MIPLLNAQFQGLFGNYRLCRRYIHLIAETTPQLLSAKIAKRSAHEKK